MSDEYNEEDVEVLVDLGPKNNFKVFIHQDNWKAKLILEALLNSRYIKSGKYWLITYFDLLTFKDKLDDINATDRGMTEEAYEQFTLFGTYLDELERMKNGEYNSDLAVLDALVNTELFKDQKSGIRFLAAQFASGLFDEMGLGKTFEMLATFVLWKHIGLADKALVITKNDVKSGWSKQARLHTNLTFTVLGNGTWVCLQGLKHYERDPTDLLILNFESLIDRKDKPGEDGVRVKSEIKQRIIDLAFDVVFIDEFHLAKNEEALRSQAVQEILDKTKPKKRNLQKLFIELEDGRIIQRIVNIDNQKYGVDQEVNISGLV